MVQTPYSVMDVLKEGICSLYSEFCLDNFNIMYAIIQLFMTCYLNNLGLVFADYVYLIQYFFFLFSLLLGLAIASAGPHERLSEMRAPPRLFVPWIYDPLNDSFAQEESVLNAL